VKSPNYYGYSNPEVDKAATASMATSNQEARKASLATVQELLYKDAARIFLYTENELHALLAGVSGVQPHPVNIFWNIKDWKLS
jgi:ABC-type transport system substrate-binding protein